MTETKRTRWALGSLGLGNLMVTQTFRCRTCVFQTQPPQVFGACRVWQRAVSSWPPTCCRFGHVILADAHTVILRLSAFDFAILVCVTCQAESLVLARFQPLQACRANPENNPIETWRAKPFFGDSHNPSYSLFAAWRRPEYFAGLEYWSWSISKWVFCFSLSVSSSLIPSAGVLAPLAISRHNK